MRSLIRRAAGTVAAAAGAGVLAAGMVVTAAGATGAAAAVTTVTGVPAPLPANAGSNPLAELLSVSCASAGNCTAVGDYIDSSGTPQGLLLTQTSGTWATGVQAALPANAGSNPAAELPSVSCASAGNCTAVGGYTDSSGHRQGLLLDETSGTWATGVQAALPAGAGSNPVAFLNSVSCASAGNCTAVGLYDDSSGTSQGLLLNETSGTWATGVLAALPAGADSPSVAVLTSVSCASAGNCTALGSYTDSSGGRQGLLLDEISGTWATGVLAALPAGAGSNPAALLTSVSCASAGNCTAVGGYTDSSGGPQGLLLDEISGTWATGVLAAPPAGAGSNPAALLASVSCASAGNCTAVGGYTDSSGGRQGLLLDETSGTWATGVQAAPPTGAGSNPAVYVNSVSCASAGNCTAVGGYTDSSGGQQGLLLDETSGTWATGVQAAPPAGAGSNPAALPTSVSCASAGNCTAVGHYTDSSGGQQGLLLTQITPVITAPAVTGVTPSSGPIAGGTTVTVTGAGFTGATAVDFGSAAASSFTVNSDTSITAAAPAATSAGTVDVTVTTPAGTSAASAADQYAYLYSFTGFLDPVANPPVVNMVHAGQSIPIQFQLGGGFGLGILAAGYPTAQQASCTTGVPDNTATATDTAGGSGLQYDATTGTYTYVWKTSKAAKGTCQAFTLGLNDGTTYTAIFEYIN